MKTTLKLIITNSNTTLVKVKFIKKTTRQIIQTYSNTTLVKVKFSYPLFYDHDQ